MRRNQKLLDFADDLILAHRRAAKENRVHFVLEASMINKNCNGVILESGSFGDMGYPSYYSPCNFIRCIDNRSGKISYNSKLILMWHNNTKDPKMAMKLKENHCFTLSHLEPCARNVAKCSRYQAF